MAMKIPLIAAVAACGWMGPFGSIALAQSATQPTDVEVVGHIYNPKLLPASDENMAKLKLPAGFKINQFATDLVNPRIIAVADDGCVYVSRRDVGDLLLLKDTDNDGKADVKQVVATRPDLHGVAVVGNKIYLVTIKELFVADRNADGTLGELKRLIDDLPDAGQHPNRTIVAGPDGMLYLSVGSTANEAYERNPESATMLKVSPDGTSRTIFASGLRNTIGYGFHPQTKELWGMDHGIDWLGDDGQQEELNLIQEGKRYGWPFVYADGRINAHQEPPGGIAKTTWKEMSTSMILGYTAHSAPMEWAFYTGGMFPKEYQNDAFVSMRGSWNRKPPSGYEVVRVHFENGKAVKIEPFLTGFKQSIGGDDWGVFARLTGCAMAKDGSLLVGDDKNGVIYRVSYDGAK